MPENPAGRYRFRPAWSMTVATLLFVALTLGLAYWQTWRAEQKRELQQKMDVLRAAAPAPLPRQPVAAGDDWQQHRFAGRGRFEGGTFLLDNRVHQGTPGYEAISAFCPEGGATCVLVNRGWLPMGARRDQPPAADAPSGVVDVEGVASLPPPHPFALGADVSGSRVIEHLAVEELAARTRLPLQPFVLLQTGSGGDALLRDWPRPDAGIERHVGYAYTWLGMAIVAVVLWVSLNLKREPVHGPS